MINVLHLKNDFKQVFRNPMMVLFFALPLFIPIIFKLMLIYLVPFLQQYLIFTVEPYYSYILAATMTFAPLSLGVVTGFMMLDDKDGRIVELMSITPLGESGYLANRMVFPVAASFAYTFVIYYILNIYSLSFLSLLIIAASMGIFSICIAFILALIATDKVKGLTFAKGLTMLSMFTLVDLLELPWLTVVSHAVPTYWVTKAVQAPANTLNLIFVVLVSVIWVAGVVLVWRKKDYRSF
jgi:fluoroquinolone transport system permease protein